MNGMELARGYYETYGAEMIRSQFPEYEEILGVGLTGSGSECYGFDDEVSRDHDFEPGFCIFLPGEDVVDRRTAFQMERAYAKLPQEFMGFRRGAMAPVGGARHGVFRLEEYFPAKLGFDPESMTWENWLSVPDYALAEAVNGEVFRDDAELWTDLRRKLSDMPEDALRKRLAGHLAEMGQSGQYNFVRCLRHGETGAAQLAAGVFADHFMSALFLLNGRYRPYYKWSFRAMRDLPDGETAAAELEWILTTGNEGEQGEEKAFRMEALASRIIDLLQARDMTKAVCGDLGKHAESVNDGIRSGDIRNLPLTACI